MQQRLTVNLVNLVLSLSEAMDLITPSLAQYQQRTALVVREHGSLQISRTRGWKKFI